MSGSHKIYLTPPWQNGKRMKAKEYADLLDKFDPKKEEHRKAFEKITYRFPYFQSAYVHYLKTLKEQEQYNYNLILKKASVLSPSRKLLHEWLDEPISPKKSLENKNAPTPKESDEPSKIKSTKTPQENKSTPNANPSDSTPKKITKRNPPKKIAPNREPLQMPYNDWVIYSAKGKIKKPENVIDADDKNAIIDRFLSKQPKIPPVSNDQPKVDLSTSNEFTPEELMTETLAKVYVQQKKYKKALYAYEILSLKYPEKNSFFANQIKTIKQLQQNS